MYNGFTESRSQIEDRIARIFSGAYGESRKGLEQYKAYVERAKLLLSCEAAEAKADKNTVFSMEDAS